MGKFSKSVFEIFDGLSFVPSKSTASDDFAVLLRRERQMVCSYIYARDDRRGNGPVAVHYWIAPPDFPDDGLDNLGVGFRIFIASTFQMSDDFLPSARARVQRLLAATPALAEVVVSEMREPVKDDTTRLGAYQEEVSLFRMVTQFAAKPGNTDVVEIMQRAAEAVRRDRPYREFAMECQRLVGIVKAKRGDFPPEQQRLLGQSDLMLHTMLSRQMYVEFLVPFTQ